MTFTTRILLIASALLLCGRPASAGPLYMVEAYPGAPPAPGQMTSTIPGLTWNGEATRTGPGNEASGEWSLKADQGSLHAAVSHQAVGVYGGAHVFRGTAQFFYDDIYFTGFSGPGGYSPGIIVNLNMHLSGELSYNANDLSFGSVEVVVDFVSHPLSGGFQQTRGVATGAGGSSGILSGLGGPGLIDTDLVYSFRATATVTGAETYANTLRVTLNVYSHAGNGAFGDGFAEAFSDFANTFHFATDGPVFDVPEGVTVNSVQAGIVNNQYNLPTNPVPEPSSIVLLGMGAVSMCGFYGRRRKKQTGLPRTSTAL